MKQRVLLLIALLLLAAAAAALSLWGGPRAERTEVLLPDPPEGYAVGNNFTFREIFREGERTDADGNPIVEVPHCLSEFSPQPAAVIFWASWSGVGREQLAAAEAVVSEYAGRAAVLPVNVGKAGKDSEKKARIALDDGGFALPLYADQTGVVTFNVTSAPTALFFDGMGNLVAEVRGLCPAETIRETLDGMLSGGE